MATYPIINIPAEARLDTEQLGSKPKFWVQLGDQRWLFKEARPTTGEDWAEKAAAELAKAIGVEAANVDLAEFAGRRGCVSRNFIDVQAGEALVHGNEILALRVTGYDKTKRFRQSDHTLENIQRAIRELFPGLMADGILTQLAGYLVLDALIGNTDRHHENWGLRVKVDSTDKSLTLSVAPSFDHASSLGRELLDAKREELLASNNLGHYVLKGRGGIFRDPDERHGENPLRFVQLASRAYASYFRPALERVAALPTATVRDILAAIPEERASTLARKFAEKAILSARAVLIETLK